MRVGRWLVVLVALLGGAAALAASDVPLRVDVWYEPTGEVPPGDLAADLLAARASLEAAGHTLVRTERFAAEPAAHHVVTEEVAIGECVTLLAGAAGRARVAGVEWLPSDRARPSGLDQHLPRRDPCRRFVVQHVCPMRATDRARSRAELHFDVRVAGAGAAEVLVLRGPSGLVVAEGGEVLGDEVVERRADMAPALANTLTVALSLLLIGLMVEGGLHARRDRRDRERTLRRFTIALPSGLRGALEALAPAGPLDAPAARALRDQLASLAPHAHAAVFQRWREDQETLDPRRDRLRADLAARRADGRQSGYRQADAGLVAITLMIRHRCELPELPARLDAGHLAYALECSLPRDDAELVDVEVMWHPRERVETLEAEQVAELFPELAPLAGHVASACAACEAPVADHPASCPACGAAYAPRSVDARLEAALAIRG
ncbi:MAG: DUF1517 domain-containing protein [Sandaracinaceae bacterium]|nr:DUF1517 domain-containing protein [Sandaracinaceae bacterium]